MGQDSQFLCIQGERERDLGRNSFRVFGVILGPLCTLEALGCSERLRRFGKITNEFEIFGPAHFWAIEQMRIRHRNVSWKSPRATKRSKSSFKGLLLVSCLFPGQGGYQGGPGEPRRSRPARRGPN